MSETDVLSDLPFKNKIYFCHLRHSDELCNYISKFPKILLIRDPRDYVVSQAHFFNIYKTEKSSLERRFRDLPNCNVKLSAAILGIGDGLARLSSLVETFVDYHIKWLNSDNSFLVRYEDIVGSPVVGNYERVVKTVRSILEFIGFTIDYDEAFLDDITTGSDPARFRIFRSGNIRSWRHEFNENHVRQFKLVAPGLVSGLGYEKDETWDLSTPTKNINIISSNNMKINENEVPPIHSYNPKTLNSVAFDNDLSSLTRRYHELLDIISSGSSPELIELLDSWAFRGFIHRNAYDEALRIIDKLISNRPHDAQWNYYKAFCLQCLGKDLQDAVKHYSIALDNGAEEFWVRYNRGRLFRNLRHTEKAYIDLERAVLLYPTHQCALKLLDKMKALAG